MPTLHWLTKETDLRKGKQIPFRILEKKEELSVDDSVGNGRTFDRLSDHDRSLRNNIIIQGDNLEALKAILPVYAGKVKCIYIDPPYNTGNAFEHYDDNMEHTLWLSMIYPRIELLREFLSEDGSIWVSIDDDEAHYLKVIMDEIFGRKNFVNNVIWEKKFSPQNDAKWLSDSHDHIICFAKNKEIWRPNLLIRSDGANARYKNLDNDPRGTWASGDISVKTYTEKTDYPITLPSGRIVEPPKGTCWRVTKEKFEELVKDNRIWFGADGNNVPRIKRFLSDVKQGITSMTIWNHEDVGHTQEAKQESKIFNTEEVFSTPKPERLLQRILQLATNENDIVLDSFLGSGTTAAVALKMNRKFIGIEMGSHAVTHVVPRLRKVIEGEQGGISESVEWKGGGGFDFYTLGEPVFGTDGRINPKIDYSTLAAFIWFVETGTSLPSPTVGNGRDRSLQSAMIGTFNNTAYYLLYNGILGDKKPQNGNVLTSKVLQLLPAFEGKKVIYGESCLLGKDKLKDLNIIFKQIPYDLRGR
ncbi:MAG TPA: site-specific DNA-methyltransferase [Leptospiraceae bacterium]|nr:site-specific DNA-methyltransferase [Leptospiraceae bacterium]